MDVDSRRVERLRRSESDVEDVSSERLRAVAERFTATDEYRGLAACEAIVICVPTPLANHREPDLGYLVDAATQLSRVLHEGRLVVLESTTYPGTTRERLLPILEESGPGGGPRVQPRLLAGADRPRPHRPHDPHHAEDRRRRHRRVPAARAAELYRLICDEVVEVSSPEVAELTKLLENIFRSVNIALVNELAQLCDRMGIDVWEVVDAAATKPFGFMRFEPGPGMGGHCLPVDPFYLAFKAREHDFYTEFIELAGKLNQAQPQFCVEKIERTLNQARKPVRGSRILVLGVAYKAGVGDLRESPAVKIIRRLRDLGADVAYHDPHIPELPEFSLASAELETELGRGRPRRHRHRSSGGGLRAGGARGGPGARLPRRDAGHRGGEPGPPVRGCSSGPPPGRPPSRRPAYRRPRAAWLSPRPAASWPVRRCGWRGGGLRRPESPAGGAPRQPSRRSRPRAGRPRTRSRWPGGLRGDTPPRDGALQPAHRVRLCLRADPALDGWDSRRLVAVRERSARRPSHPPLRAGDPDHFRLRHPALLTDDPRLEELLAVPVRGGNRSHLRRGCAAAGPPGRLLDP